MWRRTRPQYTPAHMRWLGSLSEAVGSYPKESLLQRSTLNNGEIYNPADAYPGSQGIPGMPDRGLYCICADRTSRAPADRIVVNKHERSLQLYRDGKILKSYTVALGREPIGPKTHQGDHKTPERIYVLDSRNAHSQFYKSIDVSYPNARDRSAARTNGVSVGGDVYVHGLPNGYGWIGSGHRMKDWTDDASRSPTKRWTKSGRQFRTELQSRSCLRDAHEQLRVSAVSYLLGDFSPRIRNWLWLATKTLPFATTGTRLALPPLLVQAPARIFASCFMVPFVTLSGLNANR